MITRRIAIRRVRLVVPRLAVVRHVIVRLVIDRHIIVRRVIVHLVIARHLIVRRVIVRLVIVSHVITSSVVRLVTKEIVCHVNVILRVTAQLQIRVGDAEHRNDGARLRT